MLASFDWCAVKGWISSRLLLPMSDRAPPLEDQGPVEDRHPRPSMPKEPEGPPPPKRTTGTRGGRSSQRKHQAYQRYMFQDSRERGSDKYLDPSFVPFFRPDGTSRAYKFIAPTAPPDYGDVETFRSSQVQQPSTPGSTPASSSTSRVVVVKPAAKKI